MSKYYLVASYHIGKEFRDEVVIKSIGEFKLDTLEKIDKFTSSHAEFDIFNMLYNMGIRGKNKLSIKYYKNKDAKPVYYKAIIDNEEFYDAIRDMRENTYMVLFKKRRTLTINKNNDLFKEKLKILKKDILDKGDIDKFNKIYPYNNDFSHVVNRYLTTDYDDAYIKNNDYQMIINEFSRYKTFRHWIIVMDKLNKVNTNTTNNTDIVVDTNTKVNKVTLNKKISEEVLERYENEYEQYYLKKNNNTYSYDRMREYNMDKEEYLDEEEVRDMYNVKIRH